METVEFHLEISGADLKKAYQERKEKEAALLHKLALFREGTRRQYETTTDMWFFELWHFLNDVETELTKP